MIDVELFRSNIDRRGLYECWPYKSAKPGCYGQFWIPKLKRSRGAHRIAFELWWGVTLQRRLHVCHNCPGGDNPTCCNPAHLLIGDGKWHAADRAAKGQMPRGKLNGAHTHPERLARGERNGKCTKPEQTARGDQHWSRRMPECRARGDQHGSKTHPERWACGERSGKSKLNWARVDYIRQKSAIGNVTKVWLARLLGVTCPTIRSVVNERTWKPDRQPRDRP